MAFEWLDSFLRRQEKAPNYAEKTLAAYALGMKAHGAIVGVRIVLGPEPCDASRRLAPDAVYEPDLAPRLPLAGCSRGARCGCVYRPVMRYERKT